MALKCFAQKSTSDEISGELAGHRAMPGSMQALRPGQQRWLLAGETQCLLLLQAAVGPCAAAAAAALVMKSDMLQLLMLNGCSADTGCKQPPGKGWLSGC